MNSQTIVEILNKNWKEGIDYGNQKRSSNGSFRKQN